MSKQALVTWTVSILFVSVFASVNHAQPVITVDLEYSGVSYTDPSRTTSYDASTLAVGGDGTNLEFAPGALGTDDVHMFEIYMTLTGYASDQSLKRLIASAQLSGTSNSFAAAPGSFVPNPITYDPPGTPLVRGLYSAGDDGAIDDLVDLRWFTDAAGECMAAHGLNPGEGSRGYLGQLFVQFDSVSIGSNIIGLAAPQNVSTPFQVWTGGTSTSTATAVGTNLTPDRVFVGTTVNFTVVPEPAGLTLMLIAAGVSMIGRSMWRKRS